MSPRKPLLLCAAVFLGAAATATARPVPPPGFTVKTFAEAPDRATSGPDDIALLGSHIFVGWQNGIGPKGEPAPKTRQTHSVVVEYGPHGHAIGGWRLKGKVDGLSGDPARDALIVTANEDGNSRLYTIAPGARTAHQVTAYRYSPSPDASGGGPLLTGGGTDAVSVQGANILISASAPTRTGRTAVFRVTLSGRGRLARLHPTFADNATAIDHVTGKAMTLALTDPDSNAVVPASGGVFGGDFMLDGQADQQLVFARGIGSGTISLTRLALTHGGKPAGVDDVRWVAHAGQTLYVVDAGANAVYTVTGPFKAGQVVASLDTVGTASAGTELDMLNTATGQLTPFIKGFNTTKGLVFGP